MGDLEVTSADVQLRPAVVIGAHLRHISGVEIVTAGEAVFGVYGYGESKRILRSEARGRTEKGRKRRKRRVVEEEKSRSGQASGSRIGIGRVTWTMRHRKCKKCRSVDILAPRANAKLNG
jgi:hypothetical protein